MYTVWLFSSCLMLQNRGTDSGWWAVWISRLLQTPLHLWIFHRPDSHICSTGVNLMEIELATLIHTVNPKQLHSSIVYMFHNIDEAYWALRECQALCSVLCLTQFIYCGSVQFSSVAQSCPTLCDPMNHSTPGLLVHHQLLEFTHTHVHRLNDAIQPSHPLSSPSPPAPNPSQHQSLFQWVNSLHEVAKVLEFQL